VNRGEQWGAGDATLRDRHAGPGGVGARWQRPAYVRERREGQRSDGALTGGPGPHSVKVRFKLSFKLVQKYSNSSNEIRIPPNFGWFKRYISPLQKFEIKEGWKVFEVWNNFPYRNFSRFETEFGLKFREISVG
jgi:hypothetical protein